jgi:hypothetical protein
MFAMLLFRISVDDALGQTVEVDATTYSKLTVFSSHPQVCGDGTSHCRLTEWVGVWFMPGDSLMLAFNLVTGPTAPRFGRTFMPESLLNKFRLDDGRIFTHKFPAPEGHYYFEKGYDFYGLAGRCPPSPRLPTTQKCSLVVHLRSTDRGATWTPWRTDSISGLGMSAYTPQATIALPDGTLVRRVNGDDLQHLPGIPYTAMIQLLKPKGGIYPEQWPVLGGPAQLAVKDPTVCKYQVSRIRRLRDGRYVALGQSWRFAGGANRGRCVAMTEGSVMLLASSSAHDVESGRWSVAMPDVPASTLVPNEWDVAELSNGDLLALFRTSESVTNRTQSRKQAVLRSRPTKECPEPKAAGCWVMDQSTLGNPGNFPHSGHPELLATREGVIVQFATTGNSYTTDGGQTWSPLKGSTPSDYYPRSVQDPATGDIYLFGHVGHDDPYGGKSEESGGNYSGINQSITMQKFRLKVNK